MPECKNCNAVFKQSKNSGGIYCSLRCQADFRHNENVTKWKSGEIPGFTGKAKQLKQFVRRYLHETRGTACECCGWDARHPVDGAILTEVDHIDGDAGNCSEGNLRILCPNCHSMTPTFRRRNKSSSRER